MLKQKELLNIAINAAIYAGESIMSIYNRNFTVDYKQDNSPLTEADLASNSKIMEYLSTTGMPIISEENKQLDYSVRKHWNTCWIVDPLDGTKEFVKKNDEFTVNIALVEKGVVKLGVIYAPALRWLYYTNHKKSKAYKLEMERNLVIKDTLFDKKIKLKPIGDDKEGVKIVASRSHLNEETKVFIKKLEHTFKNIETVSKGSSLKFCLMAEGKADVYPRFAPTMEWDTAAGQAICEAAGLQVIDCTTLKPMVYNRENLLNNHFLVSRNVSNFL